MRCGETGAGTEDCQTEEAGDEPCHWRSVPCCPLARPAHERKTLTAVEVHTILSCFMAGPPVSFLLDEITLTLDVQTSLSQDVKKKKIIPCAKKASRAFCQEGIRRSMR